MTNDLAFSTEAKAQAIADQMNELRSGILSDSRFGVVKTPACTYVIVRVEDGEFAGVVTR